MVHRRSKKLRLPPGLSLPSSQDAAMLRMQVENLQRQVDLLSKVFLFIDLDELSTMVATHCIADDEELPPGQSAIELEYNEAFWLHPLSPACEEPILQVRATDTCTFTDVTKSANEDADTLDSMSCCRILEGKVEHLEGEVKMLSDSCSGMSLAIQSKVKQEIDDLSSSLQAKLEDVQSEVDELDARDPLQKLNLIVEAINDNTNAKIGDFTDRLQEVMENLGTLSKSEASMLSRLAALEISIGMPCEGVVQESKKKKRPEKKLRYFWVLALLKLL